MKRIIGFLTAMCIVLSFCPASFAAVRFDAVEPDSLGLASSGAPNGGSTVEGEDKKVIRYRNSKGNASMYVQTAVSGEVYVEFKMKILDDTYETFRLQLINVSQAAIVELTFTPEREGSAITSTKLSPSSTYLNSNVLERDAFGKDEWVTIHAKADTESKTFDLSVQRADGTEITIYQNQAFNKNITNEDYTVYKVQYAFNNKSAVNYTGPAYIKDFNVYKMLEVTSLLAPEDGEVEIGGTYTFPEKVTATLEDGNTQELDVTWSPTTLDTSQEGRYEFTGTVAESDKTVTHTVAVKPLTIVSCDAIEVYLERYDDAMPKTVKVKYSNGDFGYESVVWEEVDRGADAVQEVSGTIAGYEGSAVARVYLYDAGQALFEETCEDYFDGEIIRGQYLSPEPRVEEEDYWGWNFNVPEGVIAKPDTVDGSNMAVRIPVLSGYSVINLEQGKAGNAIISFDLLFPDAVTDFRTIITSESALSLIEFAYDASIGKLSATGTTLENAFEPGAWVNFKYIANMYTDQYDLFINNVKIAENIGFKSVGQGDICTIRFSNKSKTDCDIYVDNIKMYHVSSMLDAAYEEVKLTETNVTGNLTFKSPADTAVTAKWEGDGTVIENDGTVHLPAWKSGNKNVTVSLTLSKDIGAGYEAVRKSSFPLTVKEAPPTDAEAVANTIRLLTFNSIKNENTDEANILTDLLLPTAGEYDTAISWSSEPAGLIDAEGRVYAPEAADTPVTLTATVTKGSAEDTKAFSLTVKHQPALSDLQAVRRAAAGLTLQSSTASGLSLPVSGADGVSIAWTSSNLGALSNSGEYMRPSSSQTVVMTAILTKGTARETKEFTVQVAAYSGGSGGGSNGGGGGGGGSSIGGGSTGAAIMLPLTETPLTEPEEITPIYSDIEDYVWAQAAIYALTNEGVLTGTGDGKFEPARPVKREEFVAMAVRGFDIAAERAGLPFVDVSEADWHYETTQAAWSRGLITGISDNSFGTGLDIKRQDMFVILYNAAKELGISLKKVRERTVFADDADISDYAREALYALYEAGIVNGDGASLNPLQSATRAEAAKMIYEIRKLMQ